MKHLRLLWLIFGKFFQEFWIKALFSRFKFVSTYFKFCVQRAFIINCRTTALTPFARYSGKTPIRARSRIFGFLTALKIPRIFGWIILPFVFWITFETEGIANPKATTFSFSSQTTQKYFLLRKSLNCETIWSRTLSVYGTTPYSGA